MVTQLGTTPIDSATDKPWVLLVEDEPTVSKVVGKLLDEAGYEHVSIADHNQIAAAILHWKPRCIILDSEPGSAGHERSWADAAAIRRAHPQLPVLMFTADPSSMAEARAGTTKRSKAAGYAGVIDKPLLVVEFLATLKSAVNAPQPARVQDTTGIGSETITSFPDVGGRAAANWAVSDFFGIAVHELRTPLMSISGQAQLAQRYVERDPKRAADALTKLLEQAKRMDRLIGDLLDYGRVGSGALSLEVVTFDLGVATAITIAMHEYEDTPRITFTMPKGVRIQGDPDRIAQIIGNVLDNAIKYSAPGSPIDVSLSVVGSEAHLRVTDQGLGIPDAERGSTLRSLLPDNTHARNPGYRAWPPHQPAYRRTASWAVVAGLGYQRGKCLRARVAARDLSPSRRSCSRTPARPRSGWPIGEKQMSPTEPGATHGHRRSARAVTGQRQRATERQTLRWLYAFSPK